MGGGAGTGAGVALGREALAYVDGLHNLARYLTGNASDADDLVQETYARALKAAEQFTPGTNLKAWLFRILRNTFLSLYRRERNNPVIGGLDTVAPPAPGVADGHRLRGRLELAPELARAVRAHVERCAACAHEDAAEHALSELLERRLPQHPASLALKRRLAAQWAVPVGARAPWSPRWRRAVAPALAAALVLA